jgi:hypothetical protein
MNSRQRKLRKERNAILINVFSGLTQRGLRPPHKQRNNAMKNTIHRIAEFMFLAILAGGAIAFSGGL